MKRTFFIAFVLFSTLLISQNTTNDLDLKNGFKNFKFGDSFVVYSHNLEFIDGWSPMDNRKLYLYTATEPSELYYIPWNRLYLSFTGNRLTKISLHFPTNDINKVHKIFTGLKRDFGNPSNATPENSFFMDYYWYGQSVTLHLSYENDVKKNMIIEIFNDKLHHSINHNNQCKF